MFVYILSYDVAIENTSNIGKELMGVSGKLANVGISTSCFYPMETELALENGARLGISDFEVHFSTFSELHSGYLKELNKLLKHYGARVHSVHPFYSMLESAMFFSEYNERRFADGVEIYKQFFHATARIGAKYLVFHGGTTIGKSRCKVSDDEYIERYHYLCECGKKFGVTLLHENVYTHKAESVEFCCKLIDYLGDKALFTFDNKQARRAGYVSAEFARALSGHIRNIHISDCNAEHDCLLPGRGTEDFVAIRSAMSGEDEDALWAIEVYDDAFRDPDELRQSANYLKSVLNRPTANE